MMLAVASNQEELWMDLESDSSNQSERWEPRKHKRQGRLKWEPHRFTLYRTKRQLEGESAISGRELWNEMKNLPILNGNSIDFFKRYPHLILDQHRPFIMLAWGTIYYERTSGREPFVRGLDWDGFNLEEIDLPVRGFGFTARCAALMYIHPQIKAHGNDADLDR